METTTIYTVDLEPLISELECLQRSEPMALEVIHAIEGQVGTGYRDCTEGEQQTLLYLTSDHLAIFRQAELRIADEFDIDISAAFEPVEGVAQGIPEDFEEEPWRRVADAGEAAWYEEIEGRTR